MWHNDRLRVIGLPAAVADGLAPPLHWVDDRIDANEMMALCVVAGDALVDRIAGAATAVDLYEN